jgi:osmotically-inducible protein OsmY
MEESMNQRSFARLLLGAAVATTALVAGAASITVTEQRLLDQRIQADVMGVLSRNPMLSGRVVVETRDQVVNLSGYLATQGQVRRAGRDAAGVDGVKHVVNEIRPQLGPVTN